LLTQTYASSILRVQVFITAERTKLRLLVCCQCAVSVLSVCWQCWPRRDTPSSL